MNIISETAISPADVLEMVRELPLSCPILSDNTKVLLSNSLIGQSAVLRIKAFLEQKQI